MIRVNVNGAQRYLPKEMFLVDYLESLNIDITYVAVALNGAVLDQDQYNDKSYQLVLILLQEIETRL